MKLLVNHAAAYRSSLGVRRYYEEISSNLRWSGGLELVKPPPLLGMNRLSELTMRGRKDALLWSPAQRGSIWAHNHIITVHDLINIEYIHRGDWRLNVFKRFFQAIIDNAVAIVVISNATLSSLKALFDVDNRKIFIIKSPLEVSLRCISSLNLSSHDDPFDPFILMVTNSLPHKNTARACEAIIRSVRGCRNIFLRVVGSIAPEALAACARAGLRVDVRAAISDCELEAWYRQALFVFAPSLQEGHDLPVAEALSCGARVLCSDIPVHREFYEGMVLFCPPRDVNGMAGMIDCALASEAWYHVKMPDVRRTFADVANDYRELFEHAGRVAGL